MLSPKLGIDMTPLTARASHQRSRKIKNPKVVDDFKRTMFSVYNRETTHKGYEQTLQDIIKFMPDKILAWRNLSMKSHS